MSYTHVRIMYWVVPPFSGNVVAANARDALRIFEIPREQLEEAERQNSITKTNGEVSGGGFDVCYDYRVLASVVIFNEYGTPLWRTHYFSQGDTFLVQRMWIEPGPSEPLRSRYDILRDGVFLV